MKKRVNARIECLFSNHSEKDMSHISTVCKRQARKFLPRFERHPLNYQEQKQKVSAFKVKYEIQFTSVVWFLSNRQVADNARPRNGS